MSWACGVCILRAWVNLLIALVVNLVLNESFEQSDDRIQLESTRQQIRSRAKTYNQ